MKENTQVLLKKLLILFSGFFIIAIGISISVQAQIGVSPWDVFHQGIASITDIKYGQINIIVGFAILSLSAFIKVFPGFGTILNIVFIGIFIDIILPLVPAAPNFYIGLVMNISGAILMALGSCMYLYTKTGAGPRDSFLMGMMQKFKLDTRYVKPVIEGVVIIVGIILGGNFGVGTFSVMIVMSIMMDVFFKLFNFDPKAEKQMNMKEQVSLMKEVYANEGSHS